MRSVLRADPFTRDDRTCAIIGVYVGWLLLDALVHSFTGHPALWSRWTLLPLASIPLACANFAGGRPYRWWHFSAAMLAFPVALAVAVAVLRPRPGIAPWQVAAVLAPLLAVCWWIFQTLPYSDEEWSMSEDLAAIRARKAWEDQVRDVAAQAAARQAAARQAAAHRQAAARTPDRQKVRPPIGAQLGPSIGWRTHHPDATTGDETSPGLTGTLRGASERRRTRGRSR